MCELFELQFNASIRWQTVPAQTVLWLINSHSHESSLLFSGFVQCRWIWLDGRNFICLVFLLISLAVVKQHNKTDKSRDSFFLSKTLSQNYRVSEKKKRRTVEREKKKLLKLLAFVSHCFSEIVDVENVIICTLRSRTSRKSHANRPRFAMRATLALLLFPTLARSHVSLW